MLDTQGYEVVQRDRGNSAIELVLTNPPDLILLDISMPEMDGFEVCQILKDNSLTKDIPIIFISALREIQDKIQAFEIGGDDYITKPFNIREVLLRVKKQLANYRLRAELKTINCRLQQENNDLLETEDKLLLLIENMINS